MNPIGVIILNWNGAELLRRYLPSVVANNDDALADVVVVDNGSTDASVEIVRNEFPSVKLLQFSENYGFAEGYNRALEATHYPITVLLNSAAAPAPDADGLTAQVPLTDTADLWGTVYFVKK